MKIGLIDVDSHNFPNLALMKISAFHKSLGHEVEWANCFEHYNAIYKAKIFTFTPDEKHIYNADRIIKGGTGYDIFSNLPFAVENTYPDYGLYGITDTAYGYLSRGCPRGCPFCIVGIKEGKTSRRVADLDMWWNGQKNIKLLDPNLTACPNFTDLMQQLIDSGAMVDFTQGLDIRLMTEEKQQLINKTRHKMLHFAWDNPDDKTTPELLKRFRGGFPDRDDKIRVYILTNYNSTHEEDLYRVYKTVEMGYDPYIMIYEKWKAPTVTRYLQRWCNNKIIFRAEPDFAKYNPKDELPPEDKSESLF